MVCLGDNPVTTCQQCGSTGKDWCTYKDRYAGGEGPMLCLKENNGDVAFMRSIDIEYQTTSHYGKAPAVNAEVRLMYAMEF